MDRMNINLSTRLNLTEMDLFEIYDMAMSRADMINTDSTISIAHRMRSQDGGRGGTERTRLGL